MNHCHQSIQKGNGRDKKEQGVVGNTKNGVNKNWYMRGRKVEKRFNWTVSLINADRGIKTNQMRLKRRHPHK